MRNAMKATVVLVLLVGAVIAGQTEFWNSNSPLTLEGIENIGASSGSLVFTNTAQYPWRMGSIRFKVPTGITNTFGLNYVRTEVTPQYTGWVVETNEIGGVETNYYSQITNTVYTYTTNVIKSDISTNITDVIYSLNIETAIGYKPQLPDNIYLMRGDILRWSWSYTNTAIKLIWNGIR